jgi:cytidine deaminase
MIAIAARGTDGLLLEEPISPCGICRQTIVELETRFHQPIRILLYGTKHIYIIKGIKELVPLGFTDF